MDSTYKGPERRKAPRVKAEFIVIYKIVSPIEVRLWVRMWIGDKEINARMLDLSGVGMAILTDYDLPLSSILSIKFSLISLQGNKEEQVRLMEMTGEVRNNVLVGKNKHRLGIAFTQIAQEDKSAIDNFVKTTMNR